MLNDHTRRGASGQDRCASVPKRLSAQNTRTTHFGKGHRTNVVASVGIGEIIGHIKCIGFVEIGGDIA